MSALQLTIKITLKSPPAGVPFGLQRGKGEITNAARTDGSDLTFDVPVNVKTGRDGAPDFSGPFVQGPPGGRFVYIVVGKRADDASSPWDRRAKVPLRGISWELLRPLDSTPKPCLKVDIPGSMKDGSPVCASVKIAHDDWMVAGADQ